MIILALLVSGFLNGIAQLFWKSGTAHLASHNNFVEIIKHLLTQPYFLLGSVLYLVSIIVWLFVLSKTEVSFAYPFLAISFVIVLIGGYFIGEQITPFRILGVSCIIVGILFISRS